MTTTASHTARHATALVADGQPHALTARATVHQNAL